MMLTNINKKSQGLPMSTIVVTALSILVLVVVGFFFVSNNNSGSSILYEQCRDLCLQNNFSKAVININNECDCSEPFLRFNITRK